MAESLPEFDLPTDGGGRLSDKDVRGRKAVIYFYPKDMTSGCTKQAEAFRDHMAAFEKAGVMVVGVSKDSVKRHDNFKAKHDLNFVLVSDEDVALCEAFGVWKEKSMYGRKYMGIERSTFLIDEGGAVVESWRKVKVTGHVEAVLKAAEAL